MIDATICSEGCQYYPCFVARDGQPCGVEQYPDDMREKILMIFKSLYGNADDFKRGIINMAVRAYIDALGEKDADTMLKVVRDLAYIYKILYTGAKDDKTDEQWDKIHQRAKDLGMLDEQR